MSIAPHFLQPQSLHLEPLAPAKRPIDPLHYNHRHSLSEPSKEERRSLLGEPPEAQKTEGDSPPSAHPRSDSEENSRLVLGNLDPNFDLNLALSLLHAPGFSILAKFERLSRQNS